MKTPNPVRKEPGVVIGTADKQKFISFIQRFLGVDTEILVMNYQTYFSHVFKHEGKLQACKRSKQLYDVALRYAAGIRFDPIAYMKSDKEGYPKVLNTFRSYLNGNLSSKRAALSVLQLYKLIDVQGDFSTESITKGYGGSLETWWLPSFDQELEATFPSSKLDERISSLRPSLHVSGKRGPNGPSLVTAPIDREAIRGSVIEHAIRRIVNSTQNVYLDALLSESSQGPTNEVYNGKGLGPEHSRIRIKYETGGKARAFCIVDYFTQSALSPIHKFLMDWLNEQPQDGTNNHSIAAEAVKKWTDGRYGTKLWSFDLTTATDRYPRFLEKRVMKHIFGTEISDDWETIISDREFLSPNGRIRFAVGQPLGALSSWAAFAVTHHIHVRTAGRLSGVKPRYRIIGDDIVIARDLKVAQLYISMMKDLDVPFSGAKSILPEQMVGDPVAELAKRVFRNGFEITPIPPDAILENISTPIGLKVLLETAISRGYDRASMIYPVQSAMPSQAWYPTLAFPIRNRLPQLNEVKLFRPFWEDLDEKPPAGINRGWYTWSDFSDEDLMYFLRELLLKELVLGYKKSIRMRNTLYEWSLIGPDEPVEGGDWKPEPWDLHGFMLPRIVDFMTERLEETIEDVMTSPKIDDPYHYIGGLHSFLNPEQAFQTYDPRDEKQKTKVFISNIVKKIEKICRHTDPITALEKECEVEDDET